MPLEGRSLASREMRGGGYGRSETARRVIMAATLPRDGRQRRTACSDPLPPVSAAARRWSSRAALAAAMGLSADHPIHVPHARDALEFVLAGVFEGKAGAGGEILHG